MQTNIASVADGITSKQERRAIRLALTRGQDEILPDLIERVPIKRVQEDLDVILSKLRKRTPFFSGNVANWRCPSKRFSNVTTLIKT